MTNFPFISVIIPTYNRNQVLCDTIDQMLKQDYPNYEIVTIDQTEQHSDKTTEYLRSVRDKIRFYKIYPPGLCRARNYGISKAKAEIVLFVDDDILIEHDFIYHHGKNYIEEDVTAVQGRIVDSENVHYAQPSTFGFFSKTGVDHRSFHSVNKADVKALAGGNMSFVKNAAVNVGLFDERLTGNAAWEDADFGLRLSKKGYRIVFEPKAEIFHLRAGTGGCRVRDRALDNIYYHNTTLFFLKNFKKIYLPLFVHDLFIEKVWRSHSPVVQMSNGCYFMRKLQTFLRGTIQGILNYLIEPHRNDALKYQIKART